MSHLIVAMLAEEIPGCGWLGDKLASISTTLDESKPTRIVLEVRPYDVSTDPIKITAHLVIDSISREHPEGFELAALEGQHTAS
jgi:hypothetical protein